MRRAPSSSAAQTARCKAPPRSRWQRAWCSTTAAGSWAAFRWRRRSWVQTRRSWPPPRLSWRAGVRAGWCPRVRPCERAPRSSRRLAHNSESVLQLSVLRLIGPGGHLCDRRESRWRRRAMRAMQAASVEKWDIRGPPVGRGPRRHNCPSPLQPHPRGQCLGSGVGPRSCTGARSSDATVSWLFPHLALKERPASTSTAAARPTW
jgi:hypothetical protein